MDSDVISTIKDAEAKCNSLYQEELEKSKTAVREARSRCKTEGEAKVLAYDEQCQKRLEEASVRAKQAASAALDQNQLQCKALRDVADQNMQKGVDYILGRIVG